MYEKPTLVRFGSFREVTRGGPWAWGLDFSADSWKDFFFHDEPTTS